MLVTNRAHEGRGTASPKYIIAATVLADCIHEVYPSDEVEFRKPHPASLGDWMKRYDLTPADVVIVGDQSVDAELAINIGARAVLIKRNGDIPHLDRLPQSQLERVSQVASLDEVELI